MKRFLFVFALLAVPVVSSAQPSAVVGQPLKWDQPTAQVSVIARFELKVDAGAYVDAGKTLANDASTPVNMQTFSFPIPALTPGPHTFVVRACPSAGSCSPDSLPFSGVVVLISAPSNVRPGP